MMTVEIPTMHKLALFTGVPPHRWYGQCFKIASLAANLMGIHGRAAYGWWSGPMCVLATVTFKRVPGGRARHGWVVLPDGSILDPTRWALTGGDPFIYHGANDFYMDGQFITWRVNPHGH